MIIGAEHEFHNSEYASWWADRFQITPDRPSCFDTLGDILENSISDNGKILELGSGPGYLADYLTDRFSRRFYHCADFSEAMLSLANEQLGSRRASAKLTQVDLLDPNWAKEFDQDYDAVVSTRVLHDLGPLMQSGRYKNSSPLISKGGVLVNADFIKPMGSPFEFEPGRILIEEHLKLMTSIGFNPTSCVKKFEVSIENPESHNNYACMIGVAQQIQHTTQLILDD